MITEYFVVSVDISHQQHLDQLLEHFNRTVFSDLKRHGWRRTIDKSVTQLNKKQRQHTQISTNPDRTCRRQSEFKSSRKSKFFISFQITHKSLWRGQWVEFCVWRQRNSANDFSLELCAALNSRRPNMRILLFTSSSLSSISRGHEYWIHGVAGVSDEWKKA